MIHMPNFETRPADIADVTAIAHMQHQLARYCSYPEESFHITPVHVERVLQDDTQARYFVAHPQQAPDQLAGMILCSRVPLSWRGVSGVYVEDLYVRPEYRHGLGVGRLLMAQACQLAVELAADHPEAAFIRLDTSIDNNDTTLGFYRKLNMDESNLNFRLYGQAVTNLAQHASK